MSRPGNVHAPGAILRACVRINRAYAKMEGAAFLQVGRRD